MSYMTVTNDYGWASVVQANRTTTSETPIRRLLNVFSPDPTAFIAVNEIPIYGVSQRIRLLQDWGTNWDGADAAAINAATVVRATMLIKEMYFAAVWLNADWRDPNVTASPHGEVVLEWWNKEKKLTIYVSENQSDYVKVWGSDIDNEMDDDALSDGQIAELLVWLES